MLDVCVRIASRAYCESIRLAELRAELIKQSEAYRYITHWQGNKWGQGRSATSQCLSQSAPAMILSLEWADGPAAGRTLCCKRPHEKELVAWLCIISLTLRASGRGFIWKIDGAYNEQVPTGSGMKCAGNTLSVVATVPGHDCSKPTGDSTRPYVTSVNSVVPQSFMPACRLANHSKTFMIKH